jgi:galactose oxidase-like protein
MLEMAQSNPEGKATESLPTRRSVLSKPPGRTHHSAVYDPVRDRMVVFGGLDGLHRALNDVWALSLAGIPAWSELSPAGTSPAARLGHTAIYDPVRDRMVVFGGQGIRQLNDVWALSLAGIPAWSAIAPAGRLPSSRDGHSAIYDPVRDRMVVFGGQHRNNRKDVWELSLAATPVWSEIAPSGRLPKPRSQHSAIYDPVRDRMVVFGGRSGHPSANRDVWALSLAGSPAWGTLSPAPSRRWSHSAIYDPVRDRMVAFGRWEPGVAPGGNEVWALTLSGDPAWSPLTLAEPLPSRRSEHAAIYDPVRDRIVVFGGDNFSDNCCPGDVWALTLAGSPAWILLSQ